MSEANKDQIFKVNFVCPTCGHTDVEEVLINVVQYSTIDSIGEVGDSCVANYSLANVDQGEVDRYQCSGCGETLRDSETHNVHDEQELMEWLKERDMLELLD